jgi:predicted DCC family thiol-disulfide oxidoreductase YuxK
MWVLAALARISAGAAAGFGRAWSALWFQSSPTTPLEITRIGLGAAMLFHYLMATPFLFVFWGDDGWLPKQTALDALENSWMLSVQFYFTAPWQWIAFHVVFLFACAAFMVGWRTSWVKWIVLIAEISYDHRNQTITYGVESILACMLVVLCFAPIGRALSLDRVRAVRAAKRHNLEATVPPYTSEWAGACTRLLQIQMATLFFYSGFGKVQGEEWISGDAVWSAISTYEFYNPIVVGFAARHYWLVTLASYSTILIELAYPFLIWQRKTRPYLLACAMFLHVMFVVCLGLVFFSFIMICGHLSFTRPEWLQAVGAWWKRRSGDMEMIYDGRCGFCVRSMAWLIAFDGLAQIRVRDFRTNPSPVVGDALVEKALYLVLPDGRALPGFEAYRYAVLRVPGLWWLVPFFYVPVLSRLLGHPIYNWVAANRSRLAAASLSLSPSTPGNA